MIFTGKKKMDKNNSGGGGYPDKYFFEKDLR